VTTSAHGAARRAACRRLRVACSRRPSWVRHPRSPRRPARVSASATRGAPARDPAGRRSRACDPRRGGDRAWHGRGHAGVGPPDREAGRLTRQYLRRIGKNCEIGRLDRSSSHFFYEPCPPPSLHDQPTQRSRSPRPRSSWACIRTRSGRGATPAACATTGSTRAVTGATGSATSSGSWRRRRPARPTARRSCRRARRGAGARSIRPPSPGSPRPGVRSSTGRDPIRSMPSAIGSTSTSRPPSPG
jgi:hypothetical protein